MNRPANHVGWLKSRPITLIVSCLLLLGPLAASPTIARIKQKKPKPAPARIEVTQKDPAAVLRPNSGVTFVAKVFAKNGLLVGGGEVKWSATGSDAVGLTQAVNEGTKHEVTLIGFNPEGLPPRSATINVTGRLGTLSHTVSIDFRANVTIAVTPAADVPAKLTPGETYTLSATVRDEAQEISNAEVRWSLADPSDRDYILLVRDPQNQNSVNAIGRKPPKGKISPDRKIVVAATYGGAIRLFTIPYGDSTQTETPERPKVETAKVEDITVKRTGSSSSSTSESDYDIEPAQRLSLAAEVITPKGDTKEKPEIVWSVPKEMSKYIAMLPQSDDEKKKGEAVFFGLTPEPGDAGTSRETLYVLVKAKDFVKAVPIRNGEQTVDVSWIVLPRDVVTKNFGRSISDKYYGIRVAIGNNSGNDLQLGGLSFEVDENYFQGNPNAAVLRRMPAASYDDVRGVVEQRKLSFKSRGTILSTLDTAAQIMTGFTPFFHVASRARNFSQGINILGNPVTKGIERVWPDPLQDEMNRLEELALHDDKIIANDSVYRTTVFFPRDVLSSSGSSTAKAQGARLNGNTKLDEDDLMEVRRRLGQLILVGSKLNRNNFQLRVRQGFRPLSGGVNP